MNLIPFKNTEIKTHFKKNEIFSILEETIEWKTKLGLTFSKNSEKEYEGSFLNEKTFRFRRILKSGKNSFIPIVTGVIEDDNKITSVKLKIRFHSIVYFGLTFVILSTLIPLIYMLTKISDKGEIIKIITGNLFWLIVPYVIFTILFNLELMTIERKLKTILKTHNNIC